MAVRGVPVGGRPDQFGEPALRIGRVHDAGGPHRKTPDAAEPGREAARPFGDGLHGVESRFGAFGPGHGDEPRDGVMAGRPVTEAVGEFGQTRFGGIAREERAYGMAHADHGVRRSAVHAGQEAGPPQGEHLAPGVLGELAAEVTDPVGRAARVAQGLAPAGVRDRLHAVRELLEPGRVDVEPAVHGRRLTAGGEGLDCHRRVVGEPAEPLGTRGVQSLECLVEGACRIHGENARQPCAVP